MTPDKPERNAAERRTGGLTRRRLLQSTAAGALAASVPHLAVAKGATGAEGRDTAGEWRELDRLVKGWWDGDLTKALEPQIRADADGTLLLVPFPYSTAGGSESSFNELYGWDTYFISMGMLAHGRSDIVRGQMLDQLFLIERYGFVPNANRTFFLTRSQPPLWALGTRRYSTAADDPDVLLQAYPLLARELEGYWEADHHSTPIGLATNRDSGDPSLPANLAAEAEAGADFTPIWGGDVRRCVPIQTNAILVSYAQVLEWMAHRVGRGDQAQRWRRDWQRRGELLRRYCWDDDAGFFFEYDYVAGKRLPYWSLCAYWTMWSGIATRRQAARMVAQLRRFEHPYGLAYTDRIYPSPHPQFDWLQWEYPTGWPPMHMMAVRALQRYGYHDDAKRVAKRWVDLVTDWYFHQGEQTETEGTEASDSAPILTPGHTFGQSFTTRKPFSRVSGRFPTYATTGAGFTLTLKRDDGTVVATRTFTDSPDNAWQPVELATPAPAGSYVLEMSDPVGTIAWYSSSKDAFDGGQAIADGRPTAGDRTLRIIHVLGDGTRKLWEKYNVVDGNLTLPNERYGIVPMHGWCAASVAVLGRVAYGSERVRS